MKIKSVLLYSFVLLTYVALTSSKYNPQNPPTGKTGAPSESTCGETNCHKGGTFTGTVTVSGIPDTVIANTTYDVVLTQTSNAVRAGFQLTPLDGANAKAGTLTAGTLSNVINASGRTYIRHSNFKALSAGSVNWAFKWKAPASAANNSVTLWFASLASNGNNNEQGDNPLLGSKTYVFTFPTAAGDLNSSAKVNIFPNPSGKIVTISAPAESALVELYNLNGKLCLKQQITGTTDLDVSSLDKGIYVTKVSYNDTSTTSKLIVQ